MKQMKWTDDEVVKLELLLKEENNCISSTAERAERELNRTYKSCYSKLYYIRGNKYNSKTNNFNCPRWTKKEDNIVIDLYISNHKQLTRRSIWKLAHEQLPNRTINAIIARWRDVLESKYRSEALKQQPVVVKHSITDKMARLFVNLGKESKKYEEAKKTVQQFEEKYKSVLTLLDGIN